MLMQRLQFLVVVYLICGVLGGIFEKVWLGANNEEAIINKLVNIPVFQGDFSFGGITSSFGFGFWSALGSVFQMKFAFSTGPWNMWIMIILLPIVMVVMIDLAFKIMAHIPIIGRGGS